MLTSTSARADAAQQLAGLFLQGCLPYAGNAAALRAWAERTGMPHVPDQARAAFLHGAPAQVFDGSNTDGKFVLVSSDDGLCSVVTDHASPQPAIDALEADLRQSGIAFRLVIERDDANIAAIHNREYLAHKSQATGNRAPDGDPSWRILAATVANEKGGQAMLTAAPE